MADPSTRAPVQPRRGGPAALRDWFFIAPALLVGAALRLWLARSNAGLTMDSPLYVHMADWLTHGGREIGPAHHGYSMLVAVAGRMVPGRELPGRLVSYLAGLALIPLIYFLARPRVPPIWAACAAGLVALHPLLAVYSGPIMTETTFLAILFAGLILIDRRRFFSSGVWLGLGYVVRPEALVVATGAAALGRGGRRGALLVLAGFALIAAPYVGYLSWERAEFTLSPKVALVRPPDRRTRDAEWRVGDAARPTPEPHRSLAERIAWAAPGATSRYLPRLVAHLERLLQVWPWPLMALSVFGFVLHRGSESVTLLPLLVLPLLAVGADLRFSMLFVPALAISAAVAGAWCAARRAPLGRALAGAMVLVMVAGLAGSWTGPPGRHALAFNDGPMAEMRAAGEWLRQHGRPGATVMDRKAYVPFYAGMRHVQLPDDDYDTIIEYARSTGVDYLVLEEYVVERIRPQLLPLIADARFRADERRLRTVHQVRGGPHTGVAIMEVERGSDVTSPVPP